MSNLVNNLRWFSKRLSWLTLVASVLAWPCLGFAAPMQVVVLLSDGTAPYQEAARAIREGLESEFNGGKLTIRSVVVGEAGSDEFDDSTGGPISSHLIRAPKQK